MNVFSVGQCPAWTSTVELSSFRGLVLPYLMPVGWKILMWESGTLYTVISHGFDFWSKGNWNWVLLNELFKIEQVLSGTFGLN